jgi:hypothetical protein
MLLSDTLLDKLPAPQASWKECTSVSQMQQKLNIGYRPVATMLSLACFILFKGAPLRVRNKKDVTPLEMLPDTEYRLGLQNWLKACSGLIDSETEREEADSDHGPTSLPSTDETEREDQTRTKDELEENLKCAQDT